MDGVRTPRQKRGQASFERLLDVAEEVLAEEGYAGLTIAALRERGISNGAIYWRVDSMESLFVAVHERFLKRVADEHDAYADPARWEGLDLAEFVVQSIRVEASVFERHAGFLRTLVLHAGVDEASNERGARAVREEARRFVDHVAPRLRDDGVAAPEATATTIFRVVFGALLTRVAWPEHQGGADLPWEDFVHQLCEMAASHVAARRTPYPE
jgi:AcrR family transcriptional regulator